eukprot:8331124-Heterocapsa_arctica.AAC.1
MATPRRTARAKVRGSNSASSPLVRGGRLGRRQYHRRPQLVSKEHVGSAARRGIGHRTVGESLASPTGSRNTQ